MHLSYPKLFGYWVIHYILILTQLPMLYASSPPKVIWLLGYSVISTPPPPLPPPYAFIIQSYSDI